MIILFLYLFTYIIIYLGFCHMRSSTQWCLSPSSGSDLEAKTIRMSIWVCMMTYILSKIMVLSVSGQTIPNKNISKLKDQIPIKIPPRWSWFHEFGSFLTWYCEVRNIWWSASPSTIPHVQLLPIQKPLKYGKVYSEGVPWGSLSFDQWTSPWLFRVYRRLYYPVL